MSVSLVVQMIKSSERLYGAKSSSLPLCVAMKRLAPIFSASAFLDSESVRSGGLVLGCRISRLRAQTHGRWR